MVDSVPLRLKGQQGDYDMLAPEMFYSYKVHLVSHSMTHYLTHHVSWSLPRVHSQLFLNNLSHFPRASVIFWVSLTKRQQKYEQASNLEIRVSFQAKNICVTHTIMPLKLAVL